jgi:predicted PurR-regulated permease PerM
MNAPTTHSSVPTCTNNWGTRSHVQTIVLMVATATGVYFCYLLATPFLPALVWALALAVLFSPFQCWLESKLKRPSLSAMVSVLVIGLVVLGLAFFVGQRLVQEAAHGAELIRTKVESGEWRHALEAHPHLVPLADWLERQNVPATVKTVVTWMTTTGASFVKGSMVELFGLLLTFYVLFFFLRDRQAALQMLRALSPLSAREMDRLFSRVGDTIYATVYGTLAVAAVQGLLGGLMFWWLGLPAPLLWGVVMALLAVVPMLGVYIVWVPAALFLAMEGNWGKALILSAWGGVVVGSIDNLLRPVLVGNRLKLHAVLVCMSVVGGLMLFGPAGLILGPVVLTITTVLLEIWRTRTGSEELGGAGSEVSSFDNDGGAVAPLPSMPSPHRAESSPAAPGDPVCGDPALCPAHYSSSV